MIKNKAILVRNALGLKPKEAGEILFGYSPKQAYDTWTQWESGKKIPSRPTETVFDIILILCKAKQMKIPGTEKALEYILNNISQKNKI